MRMSEKGLRLLSEWEGFASNAYLDSGGALTIGVGHLITRSERMSGKIFISGNPVVYRNGLTAGQCAALLTQDLYFAESALNSWRSVELSQNQFDALVSFIFNVGTTAFTRSTLLKVLNQGYYDQVPAQLRRWVHDNGRVVQGLVNRREKEIKLWNEPA